MIVRSADGGYTLVELLVVLGILAMLAGVALPVASRSIESAMLDSDARMVIVDLRRLENDAVASQTSIAIRQASNGNIGLSTGRAFEAPSGSAVRLLPGTQEIIFFADGTTNGGALDVERGGHAREINVAWLSGDIAEASQ